MASLPQWKVQLLERKRRDEEEGRRREKEELERLARMPAWKREIIERRRARLCSGSSQSEAQGEGQAPGGSGSAAAQAGLSAPERSPSQEPESCGVEAQEGAVLRENICPVFQNHFIQQEKQRKEVSEPEQPPRPRQLTDLSNHVPGLRTIRADNITIIECDPDCQERHGEPCHREAPIDLSGKQARQIQAVGQLNVKSSLSRSVEDLNTFETSQEDYEEEEENVGVESRRGRVSRLLYRFSQGRDFVGHPRPARSRSTDNIIGRDSCSSPRHGNGKVPSHYWRHGGPPSPPQARSVAAFRSRFEARSAGAKALEAERAESPHRPTESGEPNPCQPGEKEGIGSPADRTLTLPAAEPGRAGAEEGPVAAPALSAGCYRADEQRASPDPSQKRALSTSTSLDDGTSEMKPDPPPARSPATQAQVQARALAELRARSQKSFTIVPRPRRGPPPDQEVEANGFYRPGDSAGSLLKPQPLSTTSSSCAEQASVCLTVAAAAAAAASCPAAPDQRDADNGSRDGQAELGPERPPLPELGQEPAAVGEEAKEEPSMSRLYSVKPPSAGRPRTPAASPEEVRLPAYSGRAAGGLLPQSDGAAQVSTAPAPSGSEPPAEQGTHGIDSRNGQGQKGFWAPARSREDPPAGSGSPPISTSRAGWPGAPQRKSGKTITINPRKMAASRPTPLSAAATAENGVGPTARKSPAAVTGAPVKKRYPTVDEIRVIGGYLSLQRSCLAKAGASWRKLKISFNDCVLESTFEYPSELALLAEFGADEDEETPQAREPDEDEEEEEEEVVLVPRLGVPGSPLVGKATRRKPLLVDESCR